jgi:hypothetical protein
MVFNRMLLNALVTTLIFFSNSAYSQNNYLEPDHSTQDLELIQDLESTQNLELIQNLESTQTQDFKILSNPRNSKIISPYKYPITNPYISTISYRSAHPSKNINYKILPITLHPERANLPFYGNYYVLKLAFFKHENALRAPLIFLVPGLGSDSLTESSLYLAELLYDSGFNVVTLPSTLSWRFALSVSRSGFPGYSPTDAEDMLELMKLADSTLRKRQNINPRKYAIMGFSLGALDTSFIANLDLQKQYFNFERILMLNPPIQKERSINSIDGLMQYGSTIPESDRDNLLKYATNKFLKAISLSIDQLISLNFENQIGLADPQLAWMIGLNFRITLREVILLSQEIDDLDILKTSRNPLFRGLRRAEAMTYNFRDYTNSFLYTKMKEARISNKNFRSPNDLISNSDMRSQLSSLSTNDVRWAIYHNQNDFIFHRGDLDYLLNSNSDSRIYPLGGHLGNIWFEKNQQDILSFFKPLKR